MPGEFDFLKTELAEHCRSLERYQVHYEAVKMAREEFERTGGYDASLNRQQDQLFDHLTRERARIQELTGMIAQLDQRAEANAILVEVAKHSEAVKLNTEATVAAVKEGEKQARAVTRLTWAIGTMTAFILAGTLTIAYLTWVLVKHERPTDASSVQQIQNPKASR